MSNIIKQRGRPQNLSATLAAEWDHTTTAISNDELATILPEFTATIREDISAFKKCQHEAAIRALRIGVCVLAARRRLDAEGISFLAWCKASIPFGRMQVWRFTRIAETFLTKHKLGLDDAAAQILGAAIASTELAGVKMLASGRPTKAVQMALDFVGEKTFSDLCDEVGAPVHKFGGGPGPKPGAITPEMREANKRAGAEETLARVIELLGDLTIGKQWLYIKPGLLHGALIEMRRRVQALETAVKQSGDHP
jgi:hypothetical protein